MTLTRLGTNFCFMAVLLLRITADSALAKGSIEGAIVDFYGQALARATIELKGEGLPQVGLKTVSDSAGQYKIPDLEPGDYELTVTSPGFRREVVKFVLFFDELKHLVVGLEVGRVADVEPIFISGVVQSEGKSLADVIVTVTNVFNRRRSITTKTDKQGRYKLRIIDGGQYVITAFRPGFPASVETKRFDTSPIGNPRAYRLDMSLARSMSL